MTKKEFKSLVRDMVYIGFNGNKIRINAFYFDYKEGEDTSTGKFFRGYKYQVASNVKNISKADLLDLFYKWVENGENLPYYVDYKFAQFDTDRFRVSLSTNTR